MKKLTFISLLVTAFCILLIYCTKEKEVSTEIDADLESRVNLINPLNVGMTAYFKFDNNLKDATNQVMDGACTNTLNGHPYTASFTADRKGNIKKAINMDGFIKVTLPKIPVQTKMSIAVWIKMDSNSLISPNAVNILYAAENAITLAQNPDKYKLISIIRQGNTGYLNPALLTNNGWHHYVVTYNGVRFITYMDGNQVAAQTIIGSLSKSLKDYIISEKFQTPGVDAWKGYVDELRFYNRTLSAAEVFELHKL